MMELKLLTSSHISEIINLLLEKCSKSALVLPEILEQIPFKSNLSSLLEEFFENNSGSGIFRNGTLESFLLGFSNIPHLKGKDQGSYIPLWGHYISKVDEQQFYQLCSALSRDMVNEKVFSHIITYFPSNSILQEQLFTLGYGLLVIDAIRSMELIKTKPLKSNFTIRAMSSKDHNEIIQLSANFCSYMKSSPTFLYQSPTEPTPQLSDFISDENQTFVAETNGEIIAAIRCVLGSSNLDLLEHPQTIAINYAFTNPKFRGFGLGAHLLNKVLKWGEEHQMARCTVDFESANLLANSFWLSHFAPVAYSAIRKIDNRL